MKEEFIAVAREGGFHVGAAATVDEGIEILTGVPAGCREEEGGGPEGSVNHRVDQR